MSEFIVLGLVPGTQLQITFVLWILGVTGLVIFAGVRLARRTHALRNSLVTMMFLVLSRKKPAPEKLWATL